MKKIITPLFIMVLFFVLITSVSATWCDTDYGKRINVNVNNTGGSALTDYQVFVNLSTNPINESSMRVYNSTDCTLRPHWTENETGGNSYGVWINYSSITVSAWTNNTAIYYDNAAASSASNGTNTFEFFDDFLTSTYEKTDLNNFTKMGLYESSNPIIACNTSSTDKYIREIGNVLYEPGEASRKYKMFYTGYTQGDRSDTYIHYAYSEDGKTWTKHGKIISGHKLEDPYVVKNGSIYYLYAEEKEGTYANKRIRRYNSTDCENWNDEGTITTTNNTNNCQSPLVWIESSTWYMLYERFPVNGDAALATSSDGFSWADNANNPVMATGFGFGSGDTVVDDIIKKGSVYHCFYHDAAAGDTGKATSTNLVDWTDYSGNPILSDESEVVHIPTTMIIYTTENVFYYWPRDNSGGDGMGIYRGYPINGTSLNTDKWIGHKQGSSSATIEITGNQLHLAGVPSVSSSAAVKSVATFTNGFAIRYNRKGTDENYRDLSIGNGTICDFAGGTSDWWHTTMHSSYYFFEKSGVNTGGRLWWMPTTGGYTEIGNNRFNPSYGSFEIHDNIYDDAGYLEWRKDGAFKTNATNTSYLSDEKHILISQGEFSNGQGGDTYIDWFLVREYNSPDPSTTLGSEEQQGANPTLHIDNSVNLKEDWGRNFNSNLSANVTGANASNVWMTFTNVEFTNTSLGNLNLTLNEWVNESHNLNAPVTNVSVDVCLNSTTAGATNDTDSFYYEITKRTNTATMDSPSVQNVDVSETFYVNATCNEEYGDTFLGGANLLEDGAIIDTDTSVTNYVNFSHSEGSAGQYNYTVRFYNSTHHDNATTPTYSNVTVFDIEYIPTDATALANTTGNFWVNHTWSMGTPGNVTDSYNVSIGGVWWYNTTTVTYYNDSALSAHAWNNATVWAYNTSGNGSLSSGSISDNVQIPNNIPVLSGLPDNTTDEDVNQTDIFDSDDYFSDVDGDLPTYQVESNNQSAYVSVTINASNNVSYTLASGWNGTASVVINVTDGWGGEDNDTFLIIANAAPLPGDYTPGDPTTLQNTTGNYWVNYTWNVGGGNATDSYNVSWNLTWYNTTTDTFMKKEVGASNWGNITVYAFNSSGNGSLSAGYISDEVQAPSALPGDYPPATPTSLANTTGNGWVHYTWSSGGGANVTDSYNVSWNSTWYNNTLVAYMNDTVGEFGWANISVWAYNVSGNGSLSAGSISDETQAGGGTFTTSMGTTAYNLITYYGSTTSTAEQFGLDIGSVDYIAMYNGSFYTHTMGFSANNFTTHHGIGYYVYLNASGGSTYQRNNISDTPYNTQLFNRWNTIGWTNTTDTNAEGVATSIGSACKYTSSLNADGITYTTHTVGFTSNNHVVGKGKGYWTWVNAGVNWGRNS